LTEAQEKMAADQWRSEDFLMGDLRGGSLSRQEPYDVWRRRPQLPETGGLGTKPPAAGDQGRSQCWAIFANLNKNNTFLCIFRPK